ncbi:MAG: glutamine amidotransferase [Acidimicrobiales bacterium]|nr:MAG: glutamine amidotransferase [Acidimicrobiales bacterium]
MRIVFFLYEGLTTLDVIGPHDVLSRLPGAEAISVSKDGGPVNADTGALGLTPTHAMADVDSCDILVVPGGLEGTFAAAADEEILDWIRAVTADATWITSVCTGSLILGAAGLLEGKRATTHWAAIDLLATSGAEPVRERVVFDGNVVTGAGVSAGIDMALTLAAAIAGDDTAKALQLGIEYDPHPPFDCGSPDKASDELIALAGAALS